MEFKYDINDMFPNIVTCINSQNTILSKQSIFQSGIGQRDNMTSAIDAMGSASAKAQNLSTTITTGLKLLHSDHRLYVLKDPNANSGYGALVGILKMGFKKLFIYDIQGGQHEMEPLCVLDFYVHESRQRQGCGRFLFDTMLKLENVEAHHLAIDRPSQKFTAFLSKHYNLKDSITQMNNFVVYMNFFRDRKDTNFASRRHGRFHSGRPPVNPLNPSKNSKTDYN